MTTKQLLIALSTAVALSVAGASVALGFNDNSGEYNGGFKIGPLGQRFPAHSRFLSFAYVPHWRWHRHNH